METRRVVMLVRRLSPRPLPPSPSGTQVVGAVTSYTDGQPYDLTSTVPGLASLRAPLA